MISKESPMLFSEPMVLALLNGTKTQTRRVNGLEHMNKPFYANHVAKSHLLHENHKTGKATAVFGKSDELHCIYANCPYGKPGDMLWVRETWRYHAPDGPETLCIEFKDGYQLPLHEDAFYLVKDKIGKWRPSIHIKKEDARIWLKIIDIRVERLQQISNKDAKHEGVSGIEWSDHDFGGIANYRLPFENLWKKINGPESYDANPWVWVIKFKVVSTTGRPADQEEVPHE